MDGWMFIFVWVFFSLINSSQMDLWLRVRDIYTRERPCRYCSPRRKPAVVVVIYSARTHPERRLRPSFPRWLSLRNEQKKPLPDILAHFNNNKKKKNSFCAAWFCAHPSRHEAIRHIHISAKDFLEWEHAQVFFFFFNHWLEWWSVCALHIL